MLDTLISQFHFLRPLWLIALAPVVVIALLLWYQKHTAKQWQQMVAPELLKYLLDGQTTRINPWQFFVLLLAWVISCIALAGPSWEKRPVAVEQNLQALVIMLDLSPSMMSEDIKPSRLVRARLKIADILRTRKDGQTALLVYAGDVHVVTPLTDDGETINNIIPALHPNIMPARGSNTEAAVSRALQLLKDAAITQGDLLLITDGIDEDAQYTVRDIMQREPQYRLSILGVGGDTPTPIPSSKGGFVRDNSRNLVTTKLNSGELQQLAVDARGRYRTLGNTSADIDYLLNFPAPVQAETQKVEREFDSWYDRGHWLVLLLLPIVLYSFRRGVLLSFLLVPLLGLTPNTSYAVEWSDLWKNKNQQAMDELQEGNAEQAAQYFTDPQWRASAQFKAGNYAEAAKGFAQEDSAVGHYNRGNALAKANQLPEAIKAYDEALKRDPEFADAKKNRQLVEEAIKQQQNQDQQNQQNQQQENKDQDKQDQGNKDQQNQNQQDQQQNQDQQDNSQQNNQQDNQDQQQQDNQQNDQQNDQQQNQSDREQQDEQQNQEQQEQEKNDAQQMTEKEQAAEAERREQEEQTAQAEQQMLEQAEDELTDEERQAMEQWLRRVPDDPGGLLRNKFQYEYYKRNQEIMNGDWTPPENGAENRW
uniref:VWA domain-containing protein n=1 Tax=Cellvibrio fontiphilus TaxID=1815559 RepID=UPI002B4C12B3|nr:VWA domain-containing protein [Cellvibrio fontiphilus]